MLRISRGLGWSRVVSISAERDICVNSSATPWHLKPATARWWSLGPTQRLLWARDHWPFSSITRSHSTIPSKPKEQSAEERDSEYAVPEYPEGFADQIGPRIPGEALLLRMTCAIIHDMRTCLARHGDNSAASAVYLAVSESIHPTQICDYISSCPFNADSFFLKSLTNSEVSDDLDLTRGKAVLRLTEILVAYVSTVSASSPLRKTHPGMFDLVGVLEPLITIPDGTPQKWGGLWTHARPVILELGVQLNEAGFGGD
ncbi:hypothetical protein B0H11DRAFT_2194669 [Mycena galericulata]|nr:hypothetical protein B0H11DRAFT_2194669 [Mycena galericulata]